MTKKDKSDVSQRHTEMLDNEPEQVEQPEQIEKQEPAQVEMDENLLIQDYYRVQSLEIADPGTIRRLAGKFAAIARDDVAVRQVSFDAARAALVLYSYADTL